MPAAATTTNAGSGRCSVVTSVDLNLGCPRHTPPRLNVEGVGSRLLMWL